MIREANPLVTCRFLHRSQQRRDLHRGAIRDVCSRVIGLQSVATAMARISAPSTASNSTMRRPTCPELPLFSESRHCLKALASDVSTNNGTSRS